MKCMYYKPDHSGKDSKASALNLKILENTLKYDIIYLTLKRKALLNCYQNLVA